LRSGWSLRETPAFTRIAPCYRPAYAGQHSASSEPVCCNFLNIFYYKGGFMKFVKNVNDVQFPIKMQLGPHKKILTIKAAAQLARELSKAVHIYLENPPENKEDSKNRPLRSTNKTDGASLTEIAEQIEVCCEDHDMPARCKSFLKKRVERLRHLQ
jgi:hypothetical protein